MKVGCASVLALLGGSVLLLVGAIVVRLTYDATCFAPAVVRVRLGATAYAVPAELQPIFSPRYKGPKIHERYSLATRRRDYCPGPRFGPIPQSGFMLDERSIRQLIGAAPERYLDLERVRLFDVSEVDGDMNGPLPAGESYGPAMFGRPTRRRCFTGYYGPGETCVFHAATRDGGSVRINLYPRAADAEMASALRSVEAAIVRLQEPGAKIVSRRP